MKRFNEWTEARTEGRTDEAKQEVMNSSYSTLSVRPSVRQSALSNSCHQHHTRRLDWIDNKTLIQNCSLYVTFLG